VLGLLVVAALAAIAVVPAGVTLIGRFFGHELDVPLGVTARVVGISVLLPVAAGLAVARAAPALAERIAGKVSAGSSLLLLVLLIPVLVVKWSAIVAYAGNYTIVAIVLFIGVGLLVGHLLGGPDPDNRTALALATATRHPGVAIAVVNAVAPSGDAVVPFILLYLAGDRGVRAGRHAQRLPGFRAAGRAHRGVRQRRHALERAAALFPGDLHARPAESGRAGSPGMERQSRLPGARRA
jgi:hypothetical protein